MTGPIVPKERVTLTLIALVSVNGPLEPNHSERQRVCVIAKKWGPLISIVLFTLSDAKHQTENR